MDKNEDLRSCQIVKCCQMSQRIMRYQHLDIMNSIIILFYIELRVSASSYYYTALPRR